MAAQGTIIELPGLILPEESSIRRQHVRKPNRWTEHYIERYDSTTFLYDCFYQPEKGCYVVTAPRFLNLWPYLKNHLYANGQRFKGRIKRFTWQRCEQAEIYAPAESHLTIMADDFTDALPVRQTEQDRFAGLNVAMAMNKNNKLEWIRDWALYHAHNHGLEGVCLFDNGSTDYSREDLLQTLQTVPGIKQAVVIHAPFPYGPVNKSKKLEISPRFLQTSMFNIARRDLFNKARAILNVDIDELVVLNKETSVFDAAVNSRLGAVSFRELRVHPNKDDATAASHRSHAMVKKDAKPGNTKWCVKGSGFMNHFGWAVHRFGGGFFLLTETKSFTYLHCHSATTNWKNRIRKQENLEESKFAKAALSRFPGLEQTDKQ
ncbi:hypothetical protein [Saccharospirillum mangrovi]|uniref:hypothetical protein n=1 Tax=Saccharospirillum mangrovi TaxID=2161747 RepID=UPI000D34760A|nr:hypothetical protein [Saccharospirillum mangrovi]